MSGNKIWVYRQKGDNKMVLITTKMIKYAEELDLCIKSFQNIFDTLANCPKEQFMNRIGIFARQMPDYKILTDEKKNGLLVVRQICTGELSVEEAKKVIKETQKKLENTRKRIAL